jgi:hypothetical protein
VYSTAQNVRQDVVAQRGFCSQGGAPHAMVGVRAAQGGPTATLHTGSIGGKHGEGEAVLEASAELPAFELEGSAEWESIQPGRGGAAGAAEESGQGVLAILGTGGKGGMQGVCTGLGGVLGDRALHLCDDAHVSGLASQSSISLWLPVSCRVSHSGQSCSPLRPPKGQNAAGPFCMASWVVAAAAR